MIETFEQLSTLSELMADKIKVVSQQLLKTQQSEKFLAGALKRVEVQKRALAHQLDAQSQTMRAMSGMPHSERLHCAGMGMPVSAEERGLAAHQVEAASAWPQPQFSRTVEQQAAPSGGRTTTAGLRPHSAPSAAKSASRPVSAAQVPHYRRPEINVGAGPRRPRPLSSTSRVQTAPAVRLTGQPAGEHWRTYPAPSRGDAAVPQQMTASSEGYPRWAPPQSAALEAKFLSTRPEGRTGSQTRS